MELLSIAKDAKLIGFDVDELMMNKAKKRIKSSIKNPSGFATSLYKGRQQEETIKEERQIEYVHGNYADIVEVLA
jgi:hypothetical protein